MISLSHYCSTHTSSYKPLEKEEEGAEEEVEISTGQLRKKKKPCPLLLAPAGRLKKGRKEEEGLTSVLFFGGGCALIR